MRGFVYVMCMCMCAYCWEMDLSFYTLKYLLYKNALATPKPNNAK